MGASTKALQTWTKKQMREIEGMECNLVADWMWGLREEKSNSILYLK